MFPKFMLKNGTGRIASPAKAQATIRVSPLFSDAAGKDVDEVLRLLETLSCGPPRRMPFPVMRRRTAHLARPDCRIRRVH
jgi:hypothetical protein